MVEGRSAARPILRLGKPAPPKVAAMVKAVSAPPLAPKGAVPKLPPKPAGAKAAKKVALTPEEKAAKQAAGRLLEFRTRKKAARLRVDWRMDDLAQCRERFPALFDADHPVPLAIGIHKQMGKVIGLKRAKRLMGWWTNWKPYIAAIAAGGVRYNLDGSEAGPVTEAQREHARSALKITEPSREEAA
jgi:ProP effector